MVINSKEISLAVNRGTPAGSAHDYSELDQTVVVGVWALVAWVGCWTFPTKTEL